MPVESTLSNSGNTVTIGISGQFDFEIVQEFRAAYSDHKNADYIIDMRAMEHMDSSALGMLLNMRKSLGDKTRISIINCRPQIKKILTISRFDKKFEIE